MRCLVEYTENALGIITQCVADGRRPNLLHCQVVPTNQFDNSQCELSLIDDVDSIHFSDQCLGVVEKRLLKQTNANEKRQNGSVEQ